MLPTSAHKTSQPLRFRQIHLDFHTSEKIGGVGSRFSPQQFQEMLKIGHVDSVTLFSKCHHGMTYHDTKIGQRHPGLDFELLPRQIEACREINVKTPIYLSAGLDEYAAREHPEWLAKNKDGCSHKPLAPGFKTLCFHSPYLDYLCAQIEEVVDKFDGGDGIFLDIIAARRCYCESCLEEMLARGLDPANDADADEFAQVVLQNYFQKSTAACLKGNPERRVFHNSGHIAKGAYEHLKWNSHLELESLPTGGWGYDHFPISAKYAATTGYEFLGMTGKFHTTWGEFGGFKRPEALRYECAAMLSFGSKCSIGDQLHPRGDMNRDTYELIGAAYQEVAAKESWCENAAPVSEIALLSPEAARGKIGGHGDTSHAEEGAARMLLETHQQFDVIDLERDLAPYKLLILPDEITLEGRLLNKISDYLAGGGKLLLSGDSGLHAARDSFALNVGLDLVGRSDWNPDYILPTEKTPTLPVRGPLVIHGGAWDVRGDENFEVLAGRARPYFNRAWNHFCSHQHTPDEEKIGFPAVLGRDNVVYFAHSIFTRYRLYGQPLYRDLVRDAIAFLLGKSSVETNLPSSGRASLMRQNDENRYILHLLYATPILRGGRGGDNSVSVEVIEDLVPLREIQCRVRVPEKVANVRLAPGGEELQWSQNEEFVNFVVPEVLCHQMVEISF